MQKAYKNGKRHASQYDLAADFETIKEAFVDAGNDVKGRLTEIMLNTIIDAKAKTSNIQDSVADYVNNKPIKSIGIAAASGLILGLLLKRK